MAKFRNLFAVVAVAATAAVSIAAHPGEAGAGQLAAHRAVYAMRLKSVVKVGALTDARGAMAYELTESCDGWRVESKIYLRLNYGGRGEVENTRIFSTWESKDGLDFRFRLTETQNGRPQPEIKGVAVLDGKGKGGIAEFTKPRPLAVKLPPGTIFPTEHVRLLITTAAGGVRQVGKVVFDGSTLDNPYEISALIGHALSAERARAATKNALAASRTWNSRLAYFPLREKTNTPEFEIGVQFREDGIVSQLLQDFGDYVIEANLDRVELLPRADCGTPSTPPAKGPN